MPFLETDAGTLYFSDHRKADAAYVPTILIHGAGGSRLDWPSPLRRLPEANAIAVDLPGHGRSAGPGRATVEGYADVIRVFMDALDIPRAVICGHSMGGAITQMLGLTHPERVAGLILVATGAKLSVHPDILEQVQADKGAVAQVLKDWLWGDNATNAMRQQGFEQLMQLSAETIYNDYLACNRFDVRNRLGELAMPTLILSGTADRMTFHKYSVYLRDQIKHSTLVPIDGGGHMITLEYPQQVAGAVREWLHAHQNNLQE